MTNVQRWAGVLLFLFALAFSLLLVQLRMVGSNLEDSLSLLWPVLFFGSVGLSSLSLMQQAKSRFLVVVSVLYLLTAAIVAIGLVISRLI